MSLQLSDLAFSREVEVYAQQPDGSWSCGSGCMLDGFLILTAAHVVSDMAGQPHQVVSVRQLGHGQQRVDVKVVWAGSGRQEDAALLVVLNETSWVPHPVPVRWGRLATTKFQSCHAVGFPDSQSTPDWRDTEQANGVISPRTMVKGRLYSISVSDPPDRITKSESPWAGMSGAGVFCRNMLVGVVVEDPLGYSSRRLVAVPVSSLMHDKEFCDLVRGRTEGEVLTEAVEFAGISTTPFIANSPGALLRADVSKVPFRGSREFEDLIAWCAEDNSALSVRLVVGPGGQGKTRLARQLAQVMTNQGWEALFVAPDAPPAELAVLAEVRSSLLVVVDYAELREEQHLAELIKSLGRADQVGRLLLLARTAGEWREALAGTSPVLSAVADAPVVRLPPIDSTGSSRRETWQQAAKAFAAALPSLPGYKGTEWTTILSVLTVPNLDEKRFNRFLEIHVHALASLLRAAEPMAPKDTDIIDILIRHESGYWARLARRSRVRLAPATQKRVVAAATAWSALDLTEADFVLQNTPGTDELPINERLTAADWISGLYADDVERRYWSRVQPDLIAEHIVGQVLNENDCPELMDRALGGASEAQIAHALTFLAQASVNHPHLDRIIDWIITKNPAALAAASAIAIRVERPVALRNATKKLAWPPLRGYSREMFMIDVATTVICGVAALSSMFAIANLIGYLICAAVQASIIMFVLIKYIRARRGRVAA
jgi:hypothetical protein